MPYHNRAGRGQMPGRGGKRGRAPVATLRINNADREPPQGQQEAAPVAERENAAPVPAAPEEAKPKNKRQRREEEKKAKQKIAEEARGPGVAGIPHALPEEKGQNTTQQGTQHRKNHEKCSCMYCKCAFCRDPAGKSLCKQMDNCELCKNIEQLHTDKFLRAFRVHNDRLQDAMQAMDEIKRGVFESRVAELAEERRQQELHETNKLLREQYDELKEKYAAAKAADAALKKDLEMAQKIRKQQQMEDMEHRRKEGNYYNIPG